jgi:hypothetical protein
MDAGDPATETLNALRGEYQIDLGAGRIPLTDLGSLASLNIQTQAALVGSLHVQVETIVGGSETGLPSLRADVHVDWGGENGGPVEGSIIDVISELAQPTVALTNVGLDLGSFISNVVAPVLEPINEFLDPIRPVLDALTTPIPALSDIAGETTFTDLMGLFGSGAETVGTFIEAAADIARLIDIPIANGSVFLPLGDFQTTLDDAGNLLPVQDGGAFGGAGSFDDFLSDIEDTSVREYLQGMPRTPASSSSQGSVETEPGKFSVPILENPTSAIGILFGQEVDLIKYQAPRLEATFEYSQYIPIWPSSSRAARATTTSSWIPISCCRSRYAPAVGTTRSKRAAVRRRSSPAAATT